MVASVNQNGCYSQLKQSVEESDWSTQYLPAWRNIQMEK